MAVVIQHLYRPGGSNRLVCMAAQASTPGSAAASAAHDDTATE